MSTLVRSTMERVISDVQELFDPVDPKKSDGVVEALNDLTVQSSFGGRMVTAFQEAVVRAQEKHVLKPRNPDTIYFSELGETCRRKLHYKVHQPAKAETLPYYTRIKFLYGNILEELVLNSIITAGHEVTYTQQPVQYTSPSGLTVRGRIDGVVDGVLVDVKSASKYSFDKFKDDTVLKNDTFGYGAQLGGYHAVWNSGMHHVAKIHDVPSFIAINRDLGHLTFSVIEPENDWLDIRYVDEVMQAHKSIVFDSKYVLPATLDDEPFGSKGNRVLSTKCSYCEFKKKCWSDKGVDLRAFMYSKGPEYFTHVADIPRVPEVPV